MNNKRTFFQYVIPSVLSFALSGVYAIVDGFFVGNSIGDAGLSAINIAYPITAVLQSVGTGIGMGGSVKYSILKAAGNEKKAREFVAGATNSRAFFSFPAAFRMEYLSEPPIPIPVPTDCRTAADGICNVDCGKSQASPIEFAYKETVNDWHTPRKAQRITRTE